MKELSLEQLEEVTGGSHPCVDFAVGATLFFTSPFLGFGGIVTCVTGLATMANYAGDCEYYLGF